MIPAFRQAFNAGYAPEKYRRFLAMLDERCGTNIQFRISETPCFVPKPLLDKMARYGIELTKQLVESKDYRRSSDRTIPPEFNVSNEDTRPMFVQVDFGLVADGAGGYEPRLVELQAFPSLYGYQPTVAQTYVDAYALDRRLGIFLSGLDESSYWRLLRECIVARHDPKDVVLLEIDPQHQKTLPDFLVTERKLGIVTVNITELIKRNRELCYRDDRGRERRIQRIYNRCIVDELVRKGTKLPFDLRDELDVEWAGHPNWYFRISKFSIPHLKHDCVPRTWFLDEVADVNKLPIAREDLLLKPLYSFAGLGIKFAPTDADLAAIPAAERHDFIVQERLNFAPVIATPHGATQMEVRIMYVWPEGGELTPVLPLLRMGRGKMMGVDHNKNLEWVGGSAALWQ